MATSHDTITLGKKDVSEMAVLTITLINLIRMLFKKVSKTPSRKLKVTLDTEINSEALSDLSKLPGTISGRLYSHVDTLRYSYSTYGLEGGIVEDNEMHHQIYKLSKEVNLTLFLLALYLIPSPSGANHSSPKSDFKNWFFGWERLWCIATNHFMEILVCSVH
ncbi:hypothetical protein PSTT_12026 [Puccinia striiformis]|uniref:Uncharacterized protein n=1 Tax=Puccinia striiformis TaxID=27350 RepID=A0A2S4UYE0_9BASI|nr:hypothetical protein PSTT_12026 [Puccinia striiformis]